jgi:hypothetical protein
VLAILFGAEIFLFILSVTAAVSLGARGKPDRGLLALAGIFFIGGLTSFPVVVGRGLASGLKRIVCVLMIVIALLQAFLAIRDTTRLGDEFTEKALQLDKEIRDVEFDLKYHDGTKEDNVYAVNEARLRAKKEAKAEMRTSRKRALTATGTVIGAAFLLLVMNLLYLSEIAKVRRRGREEA